MFNVLPFGISTAGFIFTKLLRVAVKSWRAAGVKVVLFLDDGFGGANTYEEALHSSIFIRNDLINLGFLLAEDKCHWVPVQTLIWLGYVWNMTDGTVRVTDDRISRLTELLCELMNLVCKGTLLFPVRKLARVVGQLISMQSVIGPLARLRSRSLYDCIGGRASWNAPVLLNACAVDELMFWKENIEAMNLTSLADDVRSDPAAEAESIVFCDASGSGFGGYIEGREDSHVVGSWSDTETGLSSTWRELEAVHRVLHTSVKCLEGQKVTVNTDNKNVCSILKVGSRKPYLHDVAIKVYDVCRKNNVLLVPKWLPRADNSEADYLSRCTDSDDWSVQNWLYETLDVKWGPHTCDRFACDYNTKCPNFNSKYWSPGTYGIDAFAVQWSGENNWAVPPPRLAVRCVTKIRKDNCTCTLVVPVWKSAPYWPFIFPDGHNKAKYIHDVHMFEPGLLTQRGRGKNGIFDGRRLLFGLVAVRFISI